MVRAAQLLRDNRVAAEYLCRLPLPGVEVPRACPQHRVEGVDGNAPVSPQERLVEPANPDILNTPAAIAIREGMREQGAWIMRQRERAEAAPPASPEQRALL
jgi:hypothetical protein